MKTETCCRCGNPFSWDNTAWFGGSPARGWRGLPICADCNREDKEQARHKERLDADERRHQELEAAQKERLEQEERCHQEMLAQNREHQLDFEDAQYSSRRPSIDPPQSGLETVLPKAITRVSRDPVEIAQEKAALGRLDAAKSQFDKDLAEAATDAQRIKVILQFLTDHAEARDWNTFAELADQVTNLSQWSKEGPHTNLIQLFKSTSSKLDHLGASQSVASLMQEIQRLESSKRMNRPSIDAIVAWGAIVAILLGYAIPGGLGTLLLIGGLLVGGFMLWAFFAS